ncbi:CRS2-associated factor 2, mitochondrial isoform X1 [Primulina huaijiensis]|uniref:CRS2-associated factor 2, mitochondrial isoform X1 n=2 Tax=Primulina huaijiensis TaxID=1492673 RepID=UPI003CC74D5C
MLNLILPRILLPQNPNVCQMLNLISWRRSIFRQPTNPRLSTQLCSSSIFSIVCFLCHSPSKEEIYDQPFSRATTQPPKKKSKSSLSVRKNQPQKSTNKTSSDNANQFPVKSDLAFDFMYSYSENSPDVQPIGFREPPRFSPFGPGRIDRKWTGTCAPADHKPDFEKLKEERERVLGEPLSEQEITELVEKYRHIDCSRQINLGKGGVTHNMLEDIHNHWKRAEAVRIKCLGVPTLDMDNVCFHLEDKSRGKIIYRHINILLLYRGRNYEFTKRPQIPLMLWKPYAPIYPKLVKNVTDGLTFEETKEMRNQGLTSPPLMKLSRNGVYVNVVDRVRAAFETEEVVRLDCTYVGASDCKKIGVKLRVRGPLSFIADLVPCVPILFKDEQIILWKGNKKRE